MARKKGTGSIPAQIALGSAADVLCMLALTALASALTLGGAIGQGSIQMAALAANALAVFLGSLFAARRFAQRKLLFTLASAGGYLLLLLLGNLAFVKGMPEDVLRVMLPALGAATLAALLASRKPKTRRRR